MACLAKDKTGQSEAARKAYPAAAPEEGKSLLRGYCACELTGGQRRFLAGQAS